MYKTMDASNPVMTSDRRSISELLKINTKRLRQDLSYLRQMADSTERVTLPVYRIPLPIEQAMDITVRLKNSAPVVPTEGELRLDPDIFEYKDPMPISGLMTKARIPVHPPSVNNKKGYVSVPRVFGGATYKPLGITQFAQILGDTIPVPPENVYTYGTPEGLSHRLTMQMSRKTISLYDAYGTTNKQHVRSRINSLFPLKKVESLSLESPLNELLAELEITGNSSAGAPYWRHKVDAIGDVLEVLEKVVESINSGTLDTLYKEEPELFLCEVKNKLDRYKIKDLEVKTRPYVTVPAHWSLLFSIISQQFNDKLCLYYEKKGCVNAYGFSAANGGLLNDVKWAQSTKKNQVRFKVYGDDTRIVWRDLHGVLWSVNPDFQQMDGSVDKDTVHETLSWMRQTLYERDGITNGHRFWDAVFSVWKRMALNPDFVIKGDQVFRKKNPHGLMTGVVGTTLFDTIKAAVSWDAFLQEQSYESFQKLHNEEYVTKTMLTRFGLVVKPGTWAPERLPDFFALENGQIWGEGKFLGVQTMRQQMEWQGSYIDVAVPTIPFDDMVEMLVVQKDDPIAKSRMKSQTAANRLLFDRLRGYMITWGFTNPIIMDAIHQAVNSVSPEAILMETAIEGGERPESIILNSGPISFSFPNSTGFPSKEFCLAVYAEGISHEDREPLFKDLFPGLQEALLSFKRDIRAARKIKVISTEQPSVKRVFSSVAEEPCIEEFPDLASMGKSNPPSYDSYNKRSKVQTVDGFIEKYLPNLPQSLERFVAFNKGVVFIGDVYSMFGISKTVLEAAMPRTKLFASGFTPDALISLTPILTPLPSLPQAEQLTEKVAQSKIISSHLETVKEAVSSIPDPAQGIYKNTTVVQSSAVSLNYKFIENSVNAKSPNMGVAPLTAFMNSMALAGYTLNYKTESNDPKAEFPVTVSLYARPNGRNPRVPSFSTYVAKCSSLTALFAKEYIARAIMESIDLNLLEAGKPTVFSLYLTQTPWFDVPAPIQPFDEKDWPNEVVKEINEHVAITIEPEEVQVEPLSRAHLRVIVDALEDFARLLKAAPKTSVEVNGFIINSLYGYAKLLEYDVTLEGTQAYLRCDHLLGIATNRFCSSEAPCMDLKDLSLAYFIKYGKRLSWLEHMIPAPGSPFSSPSNTPAEEVSTSKINKNNARVDRKFKEARDRGLIVNLSRKPDETVSAFKNRKKRALAAQFQMVGIKATRDPLLVQMKSAASNSGAPMTVFHCIGDDARLGKGFAKEVSKLFGKPPVNINDRPIFEQKIGGLTIVHAYVKKLSSIPGSHDEKSYLTRLRIALFQAMKVNKEIHAPYLFGAGLDEIDEAVILKTTRDMVVSNGGRLILHVLDKPIPLPFYDQFKIIHQDAEQ
jgi:hypothetical protein